MSYDSSITWDDLTKLVDQLREKNAVLLNEIQRLKAQIYDIEHDDFFEYDDD